MKMLVLLALVGVILVIIPPSTAGIKCVECGNDCGQSLDLKPCKDYKKGDESFEKKCTEHENEKVGCMAFKDLKSKRGCWPESRLTKKCPSEGASCFCDTDLCNAPNKANAPNTEKVPKNTHPVGGSSTGILLISLGIGILFR